MKSIFEDQRLTLADGVRRLGTLGLNYMLTGSVAMFRFAPGRMWTIRRDDLIISKLYCAKDSRSERQMRDVVTVMMNGFDADYIRPWVKALGVADLYDICIAEWEKTNV